MRTPSLRRRAVLWTVAVLSLLLLVVGVGVDLALRTVLQGEQEDRLRSVAQLAPELAALSDQQLANSLTIAGVQACIVDSSGRCAVVGVPQRPPGPGRGPGALPQPTRSDAAIAVVRNGNELVATETVRPGVVLRLSSSSAQIEDALARFRTIMTIASVVAVALAALVLPLVLGRALRPLRALTDAARQTAAGGRGRRLDPQDPDTDLGRAAVQFDAMLEELEGAEARASAAAERLAAFLSDASHELRTPLAGVSAGAERLIRDPLDEEERDRVTVQIVREARRSARLVDDLLLVSRLGELRVEPRPVDLAALVADAAERLRSRPDAPVVEVRAVDVRVTVDRERTDQVLANLLVNARNAGARRVRIAATADGTVRVSDDGPGIPTSARERVFERLVRLDSARSATTGGAGLGLPIARGLAEAQGGSLRCVEPGADDLPGAVFELRLPLAAPAESAGGRPEPPAPAAALRGIPF
ncbi:sensor histidine kinase [Amnibacterium endophyticum]|uniref:histidine kinase n=1 Tax=Amnibacterium endophyticum TaxID=2109337 RepID=A0ABW4LFW1_9MICO